MYIDSVIFRNFRNYESLRLNFSSNINLIVGGNAQGKTNILEAIYFLSTAKSHRTSVDTDMIQNGKEWFYLKCHVFAKNTTTDIEIVHACNEKKKAKIDGKFQNKISGIIGKMNTIMFSPEDLSLVKGSPSERRRFIDILISRIDPVYLSEIQDYQLALKQRNELLRKIRERKASKMGDGSAVDALDSWDILLSKAGSRIIKKRAYIIPELSGFAIGKHRDLTFSAEKMEIAYQSQITKSGISDLSEEQIFDIFKYNISKNTDLDIRLGTTNFGPHRDDLIFTIDEKDIKKFCSQGQQRTSVLSLKLATLELMNQKLGEYPIILLDDVTSELDNNRVSLLFSLLSKIPTQTILTTTSVNDLWNNGIDVWLGNDIGKKQANISIFIVENGAVRDGNAEYKDSFRRYAESTGHK